MSASRLRRLTGLKSASPPQCAGVIAPPAASGRSRQRFRVPARSRTSGGEMAGPAIANAQDASAWRLRVAGHELRPSRPADTLRASSTMSQAIPAPPRRRWWRPPAASRALTQLYAMPAVYRRRGGGWLMGSATLAACGKLKDGQGQHLRSPAMAREKALARRFRRSRRSGPSTPELLWRCSGPPPERAVMWSARGAGKLPARESSASLPASRG